MFIKTLIKANKIEILKIKNTKRKEKGNIKSVVEDIESKVKIFKYELSDTEMNERRCLWRTISKLDQDMLVAALMVSSWLQEIAEEGRSLDEEVNRLREDLHDACKAAPLAHSKSRTGGMKRKRSLEGTRSQREERGTERVKMQTPTTRSKSEKCTGLRDICYARQ